MIILAMLLLRMVEVEDKPVALVVVLVERISQIFSKIFLEILEVVEDLEEEEILVIGVLT